MAKGVEMEDTLYGNPYAEFGRLDSEKKPRREVRSNKWRPTKLLGTI